MRYAVIALAVCGCLRSQGLINAQSCIADHAQRQLKNLEEIARLSAETPMSERMAALIRENAKSAGLVHAWTELTQSDLGRATAAPDIMTSAEVGSQAVYRKEIELRKQLREMLPFDVPGIDSGSDMGGVLGALAGGGPFAIVSTVLGIFLKKKHRQEEVTREQSVIANAAVIEAMNLIRTSPDPQLKKRASEQPNLLRMYADQKMGQYDTRIMRIERGIRDESAPTAE